MLYSESSRLKSETPVARSGRRAAVGEPQDLLARVEAGSSPASRVGALLFVGGSSFFDHQVRRAQAHLRFDRRPSYWSHVAIVLDWSASAKSARIAEVALMPPEGDGQTPERNGVTVVTLDRYRDRARYPNLAVALLDPQGVPLVEGAAPAALLTPRLFEAIQTPNQARFRFRLWDWLAPWAAYVHAPELTQNPVQAGVPLPAAAFCEYAYSAAGVDLVPGSTAVSTTPEILWSTVLHWHDRLRKALGTVQLFEDVRDPGNTATLGEAYELKWKGSAAKRAKRRR